MLHGTLNHAPNPFQTLLILSFALSIVATNTPIRTIKPVTTVYEYVTTTLEPVSTNSTSHFLPANIPWSAIIMSALSPITNILALLKFSFMASFSTFSINVIYQFFLRQPVPPHADLLSSYSALLTQAISQLTTILGKLTLLSGSHIFPLMMNHKQQVANILLIILLIRLYKSLKASLGFRSKPKSAFSPPAKDELKLTLELPAVQHNVSVSQAFYQTHPSHPETQPLLRSASIPLLPPVYHIRTLDFNQQFDKWFPYITEALLGKQFDYEILLKAIISAATVPNHRYIRELEDPANQKLINSATEFKLFTMNVFLTEPVIEQRFHQYHHECYTWHAITSAKQLRQFLDYWTHNGHYLVFAQSQLPLQFLIKYGPFRLLQNKEYLESLIIDYDIQEFLYQVNQLKSWSSLFANRSPTTRLDANQFRTAQQKINTQIPQLEQTTSVPQPEFPPLATITTAQRNQISPDRQHRFITTDQNNSIEVSTTSPDVTNEKTPQTYAFGTCHHILGFSSLKSNTLPFFPISFLHDDSFTFSALADSGSSHSFISENYLTQLGFSSVQHPDISHFKIGTLHSQIIIPFRLATFPFMLQDTLYHHTFIVLESPNDVFILGFDFMHDHQLPLPHSSNLPPSSSSVIASPSSPTTSSNISGHLFTTLGNPYDYDSTLTDIMAHYNPGPITLPPPRPSDYQFQLSTPLTEIKPGHRIHYTQDDMEFLQQEIDALFAKGFITHAIPVNHYAVPFAVKGKKRRMVIDYRNLNQATIPLPPSVPTFADLTIGLHGSVFSALDLSSAYHHLRLHTSTEHATTFRFNNQFYHWKVLPFGLTNAPEVFCRFLSHLLQPFHAFCRVYLDDIIVFSDSPEEHKEHLIQIMQLLTTNKLHLNIDKSIFFKSSVDWVGHHITNTDGIVSIHPQDSTLETIRNFPKPTTAKQVQAFLGHLAYISEFIPNFSHIAAPLYNLLAKGTQFIWTDICQQAYDKLITAELEQLTLYPFTPGAPIKLTTDASHVAAGAVLWQYIAEQWRPICFRSHKFTTSQQHWSVLDKEMFAIRFACRKFIFYLHNQPKVLLETDHKPITNLFLKYDLSPKHTRWLLKGQYSLVKVHCV